MKAVRSVFKHEFLENTIESLQCFKCKDVPGFSEKQRNRYSCQNNAHQLCEKCKNLGPCVCGSTVGKSPNPAIQKMLEGMPVYCPHYKQNCREIFAQAEDLNYHQQGCVFRLVNCPHRVILGTECKEKVLFKNVISHINQQHFYKDFTVNNVSNTYTQQLPLTNRPIKIKNGSIFFIVGTYKDDFAYFWIYSLLSPLKAR